MQEDPVLGLTRLYYLRLYARATGWQGLDLLRRGQFWRGEALGPLKKKAGLIHYIAPCPAPLISRFDPESVVANWCSESGVIRHVVKYSTLFFLVICSA